MLASERPFTYGPYDSIHDPPALGLRWTTRDTEFGALAFAHSGRSADRVTVFLHGVGGTWATWTPLLQAARDMDYSFGDVLLLDLPGFGASQNIQGHLDAHAVGSTLQRLVHDLGWREMRLVGHSMGGFLALDMASRGPSDVTSVHIVSGAYFSIVDAVQAPFRSLKSNPSTSLVYLSLVLIARTGVVGTTVLKLVEALNLMPLFLNRMVAHPSQLPRSVLTYLSRAVAPRSFFLAAQNGKHYDPHEQWSHITVPLRATFGSEDHLVPPQDMVRLMQAVPDTAALCLEEVGHFGHIEQPGRTLRFLFPE